MSYKTFSIFCIACCVMFSCANKNSVFFESQQLYNEGKYELAAGKLESLAVGNWHFSHKLLCAKCYIRLERVYILGVNSQSLGEMKRLINKVLDYGFSIKDEEFIRGSFKMTHSYRIDLLFRNQNFYRKNKEKIEPYLKKRSEKLYAQVVDKALHGKVSRELAVDAYAVFVRKVKPTDEFLKIVFNKTTVEKQKALMRRGERWFSWYALSMQYDINRAMKYKIPQLLITIHSECDTFGKDLRYIYPLFDSISSNETQDFMNVFNKTFSAKIKPYNSYYLCNIFYHLCDSKGFNSLKEDSRKSFLNDVFDNMASASGLGEYMLPALYFLERKLSAEAKSESNRTTCYDLFYNRNDLTVNSWALNIRHALRCIPQEINLFNSPYTGSTGNKIIKKIIFQNRPLNYKVLWELNELIKDSRKERPDVYQNIINLIRNDILKDKDLKSEDAYYLDQITR